LFHADNKISKNCSANATIKKGCFNCAVITKESKDGEKIFEVSTSPLIDKSGEVKSFLHIVRDITERKNLDNKLLHGEKMQAIGQLAGGVAHDFNNQLTAILGYATLLKDKVENDEELTRFVDVVIASTRRSADLTKKLLAFARKGIYRKSDNDIHHLIEEAISLVDKSLNKNIKMDLHLNAVHSIVNCDSSQIENAFLNLIINAKDAMPDGGTLKISTDNILITSDIETNLKPELYIEIKIKDSGSGMSKEIKTHIFEPFFSTKKEKGTGLGLPAVYGTITGHKGSIEVDSVQGVGTEFIVKLVTIQDGDVIGEDTEFSLADAKDIQSNVAVVLVVDDEVDVRNYIADLVKILGYSVITCSDGKEAVEIYKKRWGNIDVVLMDMIMPEMDGAEAYKQMQKINPEVKTVFISGYNNDKGKQILQKNPNNVWLVNKPFTPKVIASVLKTVLS
jgi:signal transduction histidine kinase